MVRVKISDLSVGDWVQDKEGTPAKILGIEQWADDYYLNVEVNGVDVGNVFAEGALPILITPEILEKNGFVKNDEYRWYNPSIKCTCSRFGRKYWDIFIRGKNRKYRPTRIKADNIIHIHQLQHVLRLAGVEKEIEL